MIACSAPPTGAYRRLVSHAGRRAFAALFLRHFSRPQLEANLRVAGAYRLANRTLPTSELEAIRQMVERPG